MQDFAQNLPKQPEHRGKRAQDEPAQCEKIQKRAKAHRGEKEQPELPLPGVECKAEQRQKKRQRESEIQGAAKPGQRPPQRAQAIIQNAEPRAEQKGQCRLLCLKRYRQLHQPNSRAKKPPAGAASS